MFLVRFCCANSRDEQTGLDDSQIHNALDPNTNAHIQKKLKMAKNVLFEFRQFENSLGLKNVDIVQLVDLVLKQSNSKNEIPKKDLQQTYNKLKEINLPQLKKVLTQQFFFTDQSRQNYDFSKIQLFNILYAGGNEAYKANFFFKLVQSSQNGAVSNGSTKLLRAIEYMTIITCIVISQGMLKDNDLFPDEDDEIQFEEIQQLYATNHLIVKEFATYINNNLLFPPDNEDPFGLETKKFDPRSLTLKDFQSLMSKEYLNYTMVRSYEIRQRFTEFVFRNHITALNEQSQSILNSEGFFGNETMSRRHRNPNRLNTEEQSFEDYQGRKQSQKSKKSLNDSSRMNSTGRAPSKRQSIIQSILEESDGSGDEKPQPVLKKKKTNKKVLEIQKQESVLKMNLQTENDELDISHAKSNTSVIDPDFMFQGNLPQSSYYQSKNSKTITQRHSNIEKIRRTSRVSNNSFIAPTQKEQQSTSTDKQYKTLKQFLDDMFTEQFVSFTNNIKRLNSQNQVGEDIILIDRFQENEDFLMQGSEDDPLNFPKDYQKRYPFQLREIFEYFQAVMRKKELRRFLQGKLFSEKIINMYFKILEKMNLVQLSMDNYQRQQTIGEGTPDGRNSVSSNLLLGTNTMKIQYLTTNFVRKLRMQNNLDTETADLSQVDQNLLQYFNHDLILLPFFFDEIDTREGDNHKHIYQKNPESGQMEALCGCAEDKRAVLVSVKVLDNQVDLFDKEYRDHDNHDISNCVLHVMDVASKLQNIELNEELIDADIENIQGVDLDEEMVVTICYIAECFTFGREPDLDNINIEYQRKHIIDVFISLLNFQ